MCDEDEETTWYKKVKIPDKPLSEWTDVQTNNLAEAEVCRCLERQGYEILYQDLDCDGEFIPIVAQLGEDEAVLVDVYATKTGKEGMPFLELFSDDIVHMRRRMGLYLANHFVYPKVRYDFFAVNFITPQRATTRHLIGAALFQSANV